MIKNIQVVKNQCSFDLPKNDISKANAIRRALIADVESFAPQEVNFVINTSCQTDEYVAHRIGLIPFHDPYFSEDVNPEEVIMTFDLNGKYFMAEDLKGPYKPTENIPIIKLVEGQEIKGSVKFKKSCGQTHARFCPVAAAGYDILQDHIHFQFESINGENPLKHLLEALKKLQFRLGNVRYQIESGDI